MLTEFLTCNTATKLSLIHRAPINLLRQKTAQTPKKPHQSATLTPPRTTRTLRTPSRTRDKEETHEPENKKSLKNMIVRALKARDIVKGEHEEWKGWYTQVYQSCQFVLVSNFKKKEYWKQGVLSRGLLLNWVFARRVVSVSGISYHLFSFTTLFPFSLFLRMQRKQVASELICEAELRRIVYSHLDFYNGLMMTVQEVGVGDEEAVVVR